MDGGGASELAAGGSEPAPCSPASRMVARVLWDADATGGTRSDGAENSRSDCGCNSRKEESDCHLGGGASKPVSASGGASELAAGGSTPEPTAAAASPEAAAAFGSSSSRLSRGGASGQAAPEAAVEEAAVPEAAVPEAAGPEAAVPEAVVPEAAVPKAAAAEVAVPQSPRQIRRVDVAEFAQLFSGAPAFGAAPVANKKPFSSWVGLRG